MSEIIARLVKFAGILFALLLLGFTGYQTWSLLFEVTSNPFIATLGLVVFEGGMLYWWFYFQTGAQGLGQMALSIGMFLVGLLLVCGATALHLGAVGAETFGADTPAKLITAAVIANVIAKFFMPLMSPETLLAAKTKAVEGKILDKSFKMLDSKADDMSQDLAGSISDDMLTDLRQKILASRRRPTLIEGEVHYKDSGPSPLSAPIAYPNGRPPVKAEQTSPPSPTVDGRRNQQPAYQVWLHNGRRAIHMIEETYDWPEADGTAKEAAESAPPGHYIIIKLGDGVVAQYAAPEAVEESNSGRPVSPPYTLILNGFNASNLQLLAHRDIAKIKEKITEEVESAEPGDRFTILQKGKPVETYYVIEENGRMVARNPQKETDNNRPTQRP